MRRLILTFALLTFLGAPAFAQNSAIGFQLGASQPTEDGVHFNFDDTVKELWFSTDLEFGTILKIKGGQVNTGRVPENLDFSGDGKIDYIDAIVEYKFDEVFGSTALFAGPGYYRQRFGDFEENDFGLTAGVNGLFPITRRLGFTAELAYHWMNFEKQRSFINATGGLRIGF